MWRWKSKSIFFWYIIIRDLIEGKVEGKENVYLYILIIAITYNGCTLSTKRCEKTIKY